VSALVWFRGLFPLSSQAPPEAGPTGEADIRLDATARQTYAHLAVLAPHH
jgi:hypothetical protein